MTSGDLPDLPYGSAGLWWLPGDARCAMQARTALGTALAFLRFPRPAIEDGVLAVSELASNAHQHAARSSHEVGDTPVELWIWARTHPRQELVVSVFDTRRGALPHMTCDDLLAESGRGLQIVEAVTADWGCHLSRSRLDPRSDPVRGKATWFALPLPPDWPAPQEPVPPAVAAQQLTLVLASLRIPATRRSDNTGISVVTAGTLNIWVEPKAFSWQSSDGDYVRQPLIDLQETVERVVGELETADHSTLQ